MANVKEESKTTKAIQMTFAVNSYLIDKMGIGIGAVSSLCLSRNKGTIRISKWLKLGAYRSMSLKCLSDSLWEFYSSRNIILLNPEQVPPALLSTQPDG